MINESLENGWSCEKNRKILRFVFVRSFRLVYSLLQSPQPTPKDPKKIARLPVSCP